MGLQRLFTSLELAVIAEACRFQDSTAGVTAILPNRKDSEIIYPVAINGGIVLPRDLRNYFTRHHIIIHCACFLVANSEEEEKECILKIRQRKTEPTGFIETYSLCDSCKWSVNWCTHFSFEIGVFHICKDERYAVECPNSTAFMKSLGVLEASRNTRATTQSCTPETSRKTRSSLSQVATGTGKRLENVADNLRKSLKGKEKQRHRSPSERYASLSPTPNTFSIEAYRMSNGPHMQWSSESAGPSPATSASEGYFRVLFTQANKEFKDIAPYLAQASNPDIGGSAYELEGVLSKCDHCRRLFLPLAYKIHIQTELGLIN
ncbi:hypothetical protein M422DRAFT_254327 [Sphaerobolus stellatus SS14]|uniref:Unplaced genomic scaffold SPHSTscaffold_54, whole genome shotgun sequence n=1 Tax=Sphaerobolus stellatus (strain SS14) TaxID=990650 RepID=A0A0C9UHK2_SPHS4|nr:hypothetical protein M422DRAFT_254327 [Sphaerobolus stellatus SS14]